MRRADPVSLVAALVVLALAGVLLADVSFEYALPAALAGVGLVLVTAGASRGR